MRIGINAFFGDPAPEPDFAFLASLGVSVIRTDFSRYVVSLDVEGIHARVREFVPHEDMTLMALICGGHMDCEDGSSRRRIEPYEAAEAAVAILRAAEVEGLPFERLQLHIGNEADLAHPGYAERPEDAATLTNAVRTAARAWGFTGDVIAPSVSNLNVRALGGRERFWERSRPGYLPQMMAAGLPPDVIVAVHRYPDGGEDHLDAHAGFRSRAAEWDRLRAIIGPDRRVIVTECGYHTAQGERTDEAVADGVAWDLDFYAQRGVEVATIFQINDGPEDTMEHRYGVRRLDGTEKAVCLVLRARGD